MERGVTRRLVSPQVDGHAHVLLSGAAGQVCPPGAFFPPRRLNLIFHIPISVLSLKKIYMPM